MTGTGAGDQQDKPKQQSLFLNIGLKKSVKFESRAEHTKTASGRGNKSIEDLLPEGTKVCNCARCGRLLLGDAHKPEGKLEGIAGRVYGRPYCIRCLPHAKRQPRPPENSLKIPDQTT